MYVGILPPGTQQLEQGGREHRITVTLAFALFDMNDHPFAIDVSHAEVNHFAGPQACTVGHAQGSLIFEIASGLQEPSDLLQAQDNRYLARFVHMTQL